MQPFNPDLRPVEIEPNHDPAVDQKALGEENGVKRNSALKAAAVLMIIIAIVVIAMALYTTGTPADTVVPTTAIDPAA